MNEVTYMSKEDAAVTRERKQVVVDRELDRIYKKHKTISTEILLSAAKAPSHPLHKYFEWDDSVAAEKYRQVQALQLIMASKMVVVLKEDGNGPAKVVGSSGRAEVRKLVSAFKGEGFKMRNEALGDDDERKAMVEKKKSVLRSWCRSVIDIEELATIRETIDSLLE